MQGDTDISVAGSVTRERAPMNFLDERLPGRFWTRCIPEPNSGCWLWVGLLNKPEGYGQIAVDRVVHRAHRLSFVAHYGAIKPGLVVMHRCDQPSCVNPAHLRAGTQRENLQDARRKGRMLPGYSQRAAALDHAEIRQRRAAGELCVDIARSVGVSASLISLITLGKRHVG